MASINGNNPKMKAKEVIRIGRSLAVAPAMADCIRFLPLNLCIKANSTIRIAFFANKPMSMIKLICRNILLSRPNKRANRNAPAKPIGNESRTENGNI
ncbi:hypothetical protein D3C78_1710270 [compost metagenome]